MSEEQTRVLHVLSQLERSGAEMMLLQSADEWRRRGYALDLLATGPLVGPMGRVLRRAGYGIYHLPFRSAHRYAPSPAFAPGFLKLCRRRGYQILHLHTEAAMPLFVALGRSAGVPTIVRTVHSTFTFQGALGLRKRLERRLARAVGVRFAFVSESVGEVEMEYFKNPGTVTPNWFDTDHFRPPNEQERAEARRALGCADDVVVLVTVGNCTQIKNHEALLHALALLRQAGDQRRLLYLHVGREQSGGAERQLAKNLGLDEIARFVGSNPDPRPFLWAADLFVMPSRNEGLGNSALEAVGAGTPALFTDVRGLRDIARKTAWVKKTSLEPEAMAADLRGCCDVPRDVARGRALADSETVHREYSIEGGVRHLVQALYRDQRWQAPTAMPLSSVQTR